MHLLYNTLFIFFSLCGFGLLLILIVLILNVNNVFNRGLFIYSVVAAHAHCCFSCTFCTVDYEDIHVHINISSVYMF